MANRVAGGVKAGSTNVSLDVLLLSATDGTELAGKVAGDCTALYWRQGGAPVSITLAALSAITDAWTSGGFLGAPGMAGSYRLDVPDAAFATGADWVEVNISCSGSFIFKERLALETVGAAEANVGILAIKAVTDLLTFTVAGRVDATTINSNMTESTIATAVWNSVVESQGSYTAKQVQSIILAILAGVTASGGLTFKTSNGTATRAVAVTNASNERTAMTLTPSS